MSCSQCVCPFSSSALSLQPVLAFPTSFQVLPVHTATARLCAYSILACLLLAQEVPDPRWPSWAVHPATCLDTTCRDTFSASGSGQSIFLWLQSLFSVGQRKLPQRPFLALLWLPSGYTTGLRNSSLVVFLQDASHLYSDFYSVPTLPSLLGFLRGGIALLKLLSLLF